MTCAGQMRVGEETGCERHAGRKEGKTRVTLKGPSIGGPFTSEMYEVVSVVLSPTRLKDISLLAANMKHKSVKREIGNEALPHRPDSGAMPVCTSPSCKKRAAKLLRTVSAIVERTFSPDVS